ncbi:MAG: NAD kinase [Cytophagaceae bacterium]|nr:NAD kinase [Cytophagaceae bacterium]
MNIAIHGRPFNDDTLPYIQDMFSHLEKSEIKLQLFNQFKIFLEKKGLKLPRHSVYTLKNELSEANFILSIGGDGTLLETVTYSAEKEIPVLGINTGRLGFLATTAREKTKEVIDDLLSGNYKLEERTLIKLVSDEDLFNGVNFAMNEMAILKRDSSSMIVIHTYLDGEYLNSYWSDGLIVSTPTGSTGYCLSVGGPIVLPQSNNFIIAPVSPHNLNVRPLIVTDNSVISFEIEGRSKNFLVSLDSRSRTVSSDKKLTVKKEDFKARLVELKGYNFLQTLRNKLNWGLDLRN